MRMVGSPAADAGRVPVRGDQVSVRREDVGRAVDLVLGRLAGQPLNLGHQGGIFPTQSGDRPSVIRLLLWGCPPHIAGSVRTVIVNAVKGVLTGGARANIPRESCEVIAPHSRDTYSPAAVPWIRWVCRDEASASDA